MIKLPKNASEHMEQVFFVSWFRKTFLEVRIFAIPNGGGRSAGEGAKFKAEGVSAGVPDLYVPEWFLWIEMKRKKDGRVSTEQAGWIEYLEGIEKYSVFVANGFEDAKKKTLDFLEASDMYMDIVIHIRELDNDQYNS